MKKIELYSTYSTTVSPCQKYLSEQAVVDPGQVCPSARGLFSDTRPLNYCAWRRQQSRFLLTLAFLLYFSKVLSFFAFKAHTLLIYRIISSCPLKDTFQKYIASKKKN